MLHEMRKLYQAALASKAPNLIKSAPASRPLAAESLPKEKPHGQDAPDANGGDCVDD